MQIELQELRRRKAGGITASAVRSQARTVRSLADVNRGSGSLPVCSSRLTPRAKSQPPPQTPSLAAASSRPAAPGPVAPAFERRSASVSARVSSHRRILLPLRCTHRDRILVAVAVPGTPTRQPRTDRPGRLLRTPSTVSSRRFRSVSNNWRGTLSRSPGWLLGAGCLAPQVGDAACGSTRESGGASGSSGPRATAASEASSFSRAE